MHKKLKNSFIHKIKSLIRNKITRKIDQRILIYLVFVGISTIFWFLNKLNNEFNTSIEYPVKYTDLPDKKILGSNLPKKLKLHVSTDGFTLLKQKISPFPFPVVINLSDFSEQISPEKVQHFTLLTRDIKSDINQQLGKEFNLYDIYPDTIKFQFDNIIKRKVAIAAYANLSFEAQCMLDGQISFQPDSIEVNGPKSILDTLKYIYTKKVKFKGLNKPIQRNVALKEVDQLSFTKKRVIMYLPVSKYTESSVEVPITTFNVPDSLRLITFPQRAKISYIVSLSNFDKVDRNDFEVVVDYNEIENLLGQKLSVTITHQTNLVQNITFTPTIVEYIIEQKND